MADPASAVDNDAVGDPRLPQTTRWNWRSSQEIRLGDQERIRGLFERATHLALPPKKMKFLFRRYLEYERGHGDAGRVEHVKQAARDYVEANLAEA